MGLMDKVKSQATQLAEKAQQAGQAGQAKLAEVQAKRKGDALLLEFGGIAYTQQVGRADATAPARAAELVDQLRAFEAEHGPISVTSATIAPAPVDCTFIPGSSGAADTPEQPSTPASTPVTGGGGMPTSTGGIPQSTGGIPTGSYSSDTESEESS